MIEIKNVTMDFIMPNEQVSGIKEFILKRLKGEITYNKFRALNEISFNVDKGEVVGIVGRNGAGKSTLLKVISGILRPTKGIVDVKGNIVPMLELGSGFDYELSGRENIFLNGAILGYGEDFLKSKYEEILAFSELGDFINVPIRSYSSGMMMRLAFSIATVVNPEILIVDEILAVGDAAFQDKSKKKMLELMSGGTTVLFVSHDINQIKEMCDKVIWLEHGKVNAIGNAEIVCHDYLVSLGQEF